MAHNCLQLQLQRDLTSSLCKYLQTHAHNPATNVNGWAVTAMLKDSCAGLGPQHDVVGVEETFKRKACDAGVAQLVECLPSTHKRPWVLAPASYNLDMVTHTCNPSILEVEAEVHSQPQRHSDFKARLSYMRLCWRLGQVS